MTVSKAFFGAVGFVAFLAAASPIHAQSAAKNGNRTVTGSTPAVQGQQDKRVRWSERGDLNSGPPVPQTGALTGLRYAPTRGRPQNYAALRARARAGRVKPVDVRQMPPVAHGGGAISPHSTPSSRK
jgi:hypothetical protein